METKPKLNDPMGYLRRMEASLRNKLVLNDFIPSQAESILDVGCANGALTNALARLDPIAHYKGIDLNESFIQEAKETYQRYNLSFENVYLRSLLERKQRYDAVIFCSVLHEFYSYGEGKSSVMKALADTYELLNKGGRIIIRDMILSESKKDLRTEMQMRAACKVFYNEKYHNQLLQFTEKYGTITGSAFNLNHFLLKYLYVENWETELKEDYVAMTLEDYEKIFSVLGIKAIYAKTSLLPYLDQRWQEDFDLTAREAAEFTSTTILVGEK
jgi:2-polyprenyl-3-methyl-5-hydroxy-6-metoxy-1,4-benzoquinol methylase